MSDTALSWLAALVAGIGLGLLFFGGLWWTMRRLPDSERPVQLVGGSALLRTATVAGGFWLVMSGSWERALACLVGFLLARRLVVRMVAAGLPGPSMSPRSGVGRLEQTPGRKARGADDG